MCHFSVSTTYFLTRVMNKYPLTIYSVEEEDAFLLPMTITKEKDADNVQRLRYNSIISPSSLNALLFS